MKIILVRHGETEFNVLKIKQGSSDSKLTDKGIAQAKRLGEHFQNEKLARIYVSDLGRALATLNEIKKHHPNVEIRIDKRLRERNSGKYEMRPTSEYAEAINNADVPKYFFKAGGGESDNDVAIRVLQFFDELYRKEKEGTIMVITHGGFIASALIALLRAPHEDYKTYSHDNAAYTVLELTEDGNHKLHVLNCTEHLN